MQCKYVLCDFLCRFTPSDTLQAGKARCGSRMLLLLNAALKNPKPTYFRPLQRHRGHGEHLCDAPQGVGSCFVREYQYVATRLLPLLATGAQVMPSGPDQPWLPRGIASPKASAGFTASARFFVSALLRLQARFFKRTPRSCNPINMLCVLCCSRGVGFVAKFGRSLSRASHGILQPAPVRQSSYTPSTALATIR